MEFRQIEAFIEVIESASFSKAAEELHISQPSVSTYISSLERELGTVLINRSTKVLSITLAGERFLEKAKEMVSLKHASIESIKSLDGDISGEVRILASSVPALYILPQALAELHRLYPNISFSLSQTDTSGVVQGISSQRADIGFAGSTIQDRKCEFSEIVNEKLVFIAPNDGSYPKDREFTLEELLYSNSFISRELGSGTRMQYEKFFIENGIDLKKIRACATIGNTQGILNAVAHGLGVSIISKLAAGQMLEQGLLIPIKLKVELPKRKIYSVLNKSVVHSHLIKLLINHIKESMNSLR